VSKYAYNKPLKAFIEALKEAPCMDCGGKFHPCAMDFDHRPGTLKHKAISRMVGDQYNLDSIMEEVAKCDLVCANCHRLRTWRRRRGRNG
jgi:hypothetical protein